MSDPEFEKVDVRFPCGCQMLWSDDVLMFEPHALDCDHYRFFIAECARQNKTPDILDMR